jgi:hypothetical protein
LAGIEMADQVLDLATHPNRQGEGNGSAKPRTPTSVISHAICHFLCPDEINEIYNQLRASLIPNRQVLWSGLHREKAQHWADAHDMQTLTTAMGPLMDNDNALCRLKTKRRNGWSNYIHGASVIFALLIAEGKQVTVLTPPPPQRFNPSGESYYQQIEEPIIKGELGNKPLEQILLVHPMVPGATDSIYQMWPVDKQEAWKKEYGSRARTIVVKWRETKVSRM